MCVVAVVDSMIGRVERKAEVADLEELVEGMQEAAYSHFPTSPKLGM